MAYIAKNAFTNTLRLSRGAPSTSRLIRPIAAVRQYSTEVSEPVDWENYEFEGAFPNLMTPDPLMDLHQSEVFPPTKKSPHQSQVIVRNDPSMFLEYQNILKEKYGMTEKELDAQRKLGQDLDDPMSLLPIPIKDMRQMHQYTMVARRVVKQTGKGKIARMAYLIVVGNGDGLVGYGEAKHEEAAVAVRRARYQAFRNMDHVERFEGRTVWTEMEDKMGSTKIILRPRPVGFGLRCNPNMHPIFRAVGIKDISAKVWGSRNPMVVMKLLFRMLHAGNAPLGMGDGVGGSGQKLAKGSGMRGKDDLQRERGRKFIESWT
ncbi:hypothetical protein K474DRAFT_1669149 [Panus rudis PR-1116 ss-1]|nr:hypothetical protein K474DRAFT_1669149 [Panus rudis PR-1116 ss-1]